MKTAATKPRQTKHHRIRELLRVQLAEGRYPPGSRLPAETELPRILKAGKQTIVRALNDLVREGLIVRRRGDGTYVADRRNPPLIPGRQLRVAVLWPRSILPERLLTFFQGTITRGAIEAWGLAGVDPVWDRVGEHEPTRATWTSVERGLTVEVIGESLYSRERHPDLNAIRNGRFDGVLTVGVIEEQWLEELLGLNIPTVIVDFPNGKLEALTDAVFVDAWSAYRAAVERFAKKGLKRIHFIGANMTLPAPSANMSQEEFRAYQVGKRRVDPDSYLRLSAFRQAMDECNLEFHENWIHFDWHGKENAVELTARLFAGPESDRPEAVVCHSLTQAQNMMEAFAERGQWLEGAGATDKFVSGGAALSIHIDGKRVGEAAASLLVSRLQQPTRPPLRVGVPMRLEERNPSPKTEGGKTTSPQEELIAGRH
jgi:DNA-binding LacI/PurR family transcriptional regulator